MPLQEFFWRVVFASLVVQGAWLVLWMARREPVASDVSRATGQLRFTASGLNHDQRIALSLAWLLCAAVVLQAGSIMMAPLTALQGLVFLALLSHARRKADHWSAWHALGAALLWLVSLLTAYQAVLYLPIVAALFWSLSIPRWQKALYVLAPLPVAFLFALAEPAVLASFLSAGTLNASLTVSAKAVSLFQAWSVGGSVLISIIGVAGIAMGRRRAEFLSLALVAAYLFVSFHFYYAILFTPLLIAGAISFMRHAWPNPLPLLSPLALITMLCFGLFPPAFAPGPSRAVMQAVADGGRQGDVLIAGAFGHDWQYESPFSVRRYHPSLLRDAQAVVCLEACEDVEREGWTPLPGLPVEVWVRE